MSTNDNYDPEKEKEEHEAAEGLGTAAATGLGCLGLAFMPWTMLIVIFIILAIAWFIFRSYHGG
jgi:hypothetical protein